MVHRCIAAFLICTILPLPHLRAQFGDGPATATHAIQTQTSLWRVGMVVEAVGGPCNGLLGTIPVPTDWPGQKVRIVEEDFSPTVGKVRYRMLDGGVNQMLITIPRLTAGETAQAIVVFEVDRETTPPPPDPSLLKKADHLEKSIQKYTGPSPFIESRHKQIRNLAAELRDPELSAWDQVEKYYDYVRDQIQYVNGPLKGALKALQDGTGDCEELTSLFIALCRADGIPARTVWVPGHCYPEFYLVNDQDEGFWIPCEAAGARSFGTIANLKPILQKGDNFSVPEKKERQRYVAEFLTGKAGGGHPRVRFIRDEIQQ